MNDEKVLKEGKTDEQKTVIPKTTMLQPLNMVQPLNIAPKVQLQTNYGPMLTSIAPLQGGFMRTPPSLVNICRQRNWNIKNLKGEKFEKDLKVEITLKIRGEEASSFVPEKLYSSHKYIVEHKVKGNISLDFPLLVSKIQVVHPNTNEEILKKDKTSILIGSFDTALTKKKEDFLEGKMRIQFGDVSYHHDKGYFAFLISYFDPSNLLESIFTLKSPAFRVYARKPSISRETLQPEKPKETKKRKKKEVVPEDSSPKTSIISTSPQSLTPELTSMSVPQPLLVGQNSTQSTSTNEEPKAKRSKEFQEFQKKLESLVQMKSNLTEQDRQLANETSLEKLLAIDPTYTLDLFVKHENVTFIF
jgi:hypothetical protein